MKTTIAFLTALLVLAGTPSANADERRIAGDLFAGGDSVVLDGDGANDVFAAGASVDVQQVVERNLYVAGRDVTVSGPIVGDAYGAGANLSFGTSIAGRLYAAGADVKLLPSSKIGAGARLAGRTIAIDGDIAGSVMAAGEAIALAGTIDGDVFIDADTLTVSPDARIAGDLHYRIDHETEIPAGVVSGSILDIADAETTEDRADAGNANPEWTDAIGLARRGAGSFFVFAQLMAGLIVFVGFPDLAGKLRVAVEDQPVGSMGRGILAVAVVIGAVALTALTLIGIPLAILLVLSIPLILMTGYATGAVGWLLIGARALGQNLPYSIWARLFLALIAVIPVYLLGLIPFVGWIVGLLTTLLGLGALFAALRTRSTQTAAMPAVG